MDSVTPVATTTTSSTSPSEQLSGVSLAYDPKEDEEIMRQIENLMRFYAAKYIRSPLILMCYGNLSTKSKHYSSQVWGELYQLADDGSSLRCISLGPGPIFVCGSDKDLCHHYVEQDVIRVKHKNLIRGSDTAFFILRVVSAAGIPLFRVYNACCIGDHSGFKIGEQIVKWKRYGILFHGDTFSISLKDHQLNFQFKEVKRGPVKEQ